MVLDAGESSAFLAGYAFDRLLPSSLIFTSKTRRWYRKRAQAIDSPLSEFKSRVRRGKIKRTPSLSS